MRSETSDSRSLRRPSRHMPINIISVVVFPHALQTLSEGKILTEVVIDWYRYDSTGMEELYYKQTCVHKLHRLTF